jgi:hypothetical protein
MVCQEKNNNEKTLSYPHDFTLTKRFVVKITVERCDVFLVGVPQIFDRVKSVALWSAKKKKKGPSRAIERVNIEEQNLYEFRLWSDMLRSATNHPPWSEIVTQ